jgi:hypothetical protein
MREFKFMDSILLCMIDKIKILIANCTIKVTLDNYEYTQNRVTVKSYRIGTMNSGIVYSTIFQSILRYVSQW